MINRRWTWLSLAALLGLVLGFCGCGSQGSLAVGIRKIHLENGLAKAQVVHREVTGDPGSLDPSLATGVPAATVLEDLFEGLTAVDQAGKTIPGVASSWQVSADGKTWTFHLRPDARWSNGQPLTAADFVYAWRRQVDPATGAANAQSLVAIVNAMPISQGKMPPAKLGVEATDPHTLVVHLVGPTPYFPALLSNQYLYPLYPPAIAKWGDSWTQAAHMISNGAFTLAERVIHGHITLDRNPYYWNAKQVRLTQVIYYPMDDVASAVSRYLAGSIDFTDRVPSQQKAMLTQELGADQVIFAPNFTTGLFAYNFTMPPFQHNPALRQALNIAVDRKILAHYVYKDTVTPAYNLMPPLPGYQPEVPAWAKLPDAQRHALALKFYHQAGYSASHPLQVALTYPSGGPRVRLIMEAITAMWQMNLGAHVQLSNEEWKVFLQSIQMKQRALFWSAWSGDYPDPFTFMQSFETGNGFNNGSYSNPRYDALVNQANNTQDIPTRYKLFAQAGAMLNQDAVFIPLYYPDIEHLIKPYLKGWTGNVMDRNPSQYMYIQAHTEE